MNVFNKRKYLLNRYLFLKILVREAVKALIRSSLIWTCTVWQVTCVQISRRITVQHTVVPQNIYSKTCVKQPLSKRQKIGFQDQLSLNAGQKYCRMLLQYFLPSFSYHLSLRSLFCLFLSGHFTRVLLYFSKVQLNKFFEHKI